MTLANPVAAQKRRQGMTLIEIVVAVGVGCLVLMSMAVVFATSSRSFVAMGNYINMDRDSRNALDMMSRDIRQSRNLTNFSTTKVVFNYLGGTNMILQYNPDARQLTQAFQWSTGSKTNVLLTECDSFKFTMWKNTPMTGGTNASTVTPSEGKSLGIAWKCSRTILGKKITTEDMQQAQIVIRNKPVL